MNRSESNTMTPARRCGGCASYDLGECSKNIDHAPELGVIPPDFEGCEHHETPEEFARDMALLAQFR